MGHHCPHYMSIVQTAISSVCRRDLSPRPAGMCHVQHTHHSSAPPAPVPPLAQEFSLSAPGLSPCQQGPGVLSKKVHSSKIKDLKIPRLCLPGRHFSEQPARDMPHFASIPSWKLNKGEETGSCSAQLCHGALLPEPNACSPTRCISLAALSQP